VIRPLGAVTIEISNYCVVLRCCCWWESERYRSWIVYWRNVNVFQCHSL